MKFVDFSNILEKKLEIARLAGQRDGLTKWAGIAAIGTLLWMGSEHWLKLKSEIWAALALLVIMRYSTECLKLVVQMAVAKFMEVKDTTFVPLSASDLKPNAWSVASILFEAILDFVPLIMSVASIFPKYTYFISIPIAIASLGSFFAFVYFSLIQKYFGFEVGKPFKIGAWISLAVQLLCSIALIFEALNYLSRLNEVNAVELGRYVAVHFAALLLLFELGKLTSHEGIITDLENLQLDFLSKKISEDEVKKKLSSEGVELGEFVQSQLNDSKLAQERLENLTIALERKFSKFSRNKGISPSAVRQKMGKIKDDLILLVKDEKVEDKNLNEIKKKLSDYMRFTIIGKQEVRRLFYQLETKNNFRHERQQKLEQEVGSYFDNL